MKRSPNSDFLKVAMVLLLCLAGCKKNPAGPESGAGELVVSMDNGVSTTSTTNGTSFSPLVLNATTYKNANGDDFTVSTFKYYISNVRLLKADNSTYLVPDSYFLVDQSAPASQKLKLTAVPAGEYTGISFTVGVDSARIKAGGFTGVLNANNGMFWDMNGPEFINMKLEGRSPQSPTTGLVFHIAGHKGAANNTIRTVALPFGASKLLVRPNHLPEIRVQVDVAKLFTGPNTAMLAPPFLNPVDFSIVYNRMSGPAVAKLADNAAAGMFTVTRIDAN
ncbi:MbnP family protein [Hymenobacter arizonensis]|uniref:Copper-binding protein MbnP-like domain-containing protein n=1 Tax=Hymenobacter arizonensis TaxID=1227077 RepID=A0A1I5ZCJ2_HYMAR|nr:MbnP family protein [Hymenobacter arizonensis]SFQ54078.1 hypothetical protein SAMN04515668_2929 [Hymenobacter arizonensis]